jgi:hypothetical protein
VVHRGHANLAVPAGCTCASFHPGGECAARGHWGAQIGSGGHCVLAVVALVVVDGVFTHALHDCIFELGRLEQRVSVRDAGEGLVRLEDAFGHAHVDVFASVDVHAQASQHDGDQATGARASDEVEVVAWLRDFVSLRSPSLGLDEGAVHQLLEDDEHRVAAHTPTICPASVPGCSARRWRRT